MKIGILTSSRADYGIYLPLLKKIKEDSYFEIELIAFGTHLSKFHGYTINEINNSNFNNIHEISSLITNDDPESISTSYGLTIIKFSKFWKENIFNLVLCLGDRFEMSAAVQAGIPFGVKFAHIHGGELTIGAIDNIYRHQITIASILHFTSTVSSENRVAQIINTNKNIFTVGSLSLDNIKEFKPLSKEYFLSKFKLPNKDFALITFHPDTTETQKNEYYANQMAKALTKISQKLFLVITMPNADTLGTIYRNVINELKNQISDSLICIENFGKENYFNAMYFSKVLIGNTSSGIIEAASFGKYVINVGNRQEGRVKSQNVIDSEFEEQAIINSVDKALSKGFYKGTNVYYRDDSAKLIIDKIKNFNESL